MKKSAIREPERRAIERCPHRTPCILELDGASHPAIILDVSGRGLFVQTTAPLPEGSRLRLVLNPPGAPPIGVALKIIRRRSADRSGMAGGLPDPGVEGTAAPERCFQLVLGWAEAGASVADRLNDP